MFKRAVHVKTAIYYAKYKLGNLYFVMMLIDCIILFYGTIPCFQVKYSVNGRTIRRTCHLRQEPMKRSIVLLSLVNLRGIFFWQFDSDVKRTKSENYQCHFIYSQRCVGNNSSLQQSLVELLDEFGDKEDAKRWKIFYQRSTENDLELPKEKWVNEGISSRSTFN